MLSAILWAASAAAVTVELEPGADISALTTAMGPGDQFIFHAGTYELPGQLSWTAVGTEAEPISIRTAGDGVVIFELGDGGHVVRFNDSAFVTFQDVILRGSDDRYDSSNHAGLVISNSSDVTIENVSIEHVGGTGLVLSNDNQRIHVQGMEVSDTRTGHGIQVGCGNASCWTSDSVFTGNLIHDVLGENRYGIEILPGGQGNTFTNNVVYNVGGVGIGVSSTEFGPANTVEGNVVWDAFDAGIRVAGAATVRNNIVFRIQGNGIRSTDQFPDSLQDVVIANNTIVDTSDWGVRLQQWNEKQGMVLTNNAVANPTGRAFTVDSEEWDDGNYIAGNVMTGLVETIDSELGQFTPGFGYGDFEDAATWDFYPTPSSALIGVGDPAPEAFVPSSDFSDVARDGSAPDVGAYEYTGEGNPGWTLQEDFKGPPTQRTAGEELGGGCCGDKGSDAGVLLWPLIALFGRRRRGRTSSE
ncbi:MAG: hypothetical protein ACJAZO_002855 [Myxococcota bacterium]|jgi:hypothetical protein